MGRTHVYIVGAGFSHHAGLPLQAAFTEALLEPRKSKGYALRPLIHHLDGFVHAVFDHQKAAKAKYWPELEDVFTNIDLAANAGHHLGAFRSPSDLRMTRRVLLSRMMCMLDERFCEASLVKGRQWSQLTRFFEALDLGQSSFISMNWDTVIERKLAEVHELEEINYRCGAVAGSFPSKGNVVSRRDRSVGTENYPVIKMHGSVNWLYCDNCRQLYWFPASDARSVAMQLITEKEKDKLKLVGESGCEKWKCVNCQTVPLTTRIATFSFLKALDFPMFDRSWLAAEALLRQATKWIFIGYSLPAADYEFKHLLKRVQLSRKTPPEFVVITGGKPSGTHATYMNYERFFGRSIRMHSNFFHKGLTREAINAAHS